jgi:hypothetical protein
MCSVESHQEDPVGGLTEQPSYRRKLAAAVLQTAGQHLPRIHLAISVAMKGTVGRHHDAVPLGVEGSRPTGSSLCEGGGMV